MRHLFSMVLLLALLPGAFKAQADGFGINATRLIYPQGAASISVTLRNTTEHQPYLVQAGLSRSPSSMTPTPFRVTPPLFRMEPQSRNSVRIALLNADDLPRIQESVFWLHATAIPASAAVDATQQSSIQGRVQFGIGNIIKLFYRPTGLSGSSAAAQQGLTFSYENGALKVTNSSPYFVNLASLQIGEQSLPLDTPNALMLPPYGSNSWSISRPVTHGSPLRWQTINDTGGINVFTATLP